MFWILNFSSINHKSNLQFTEVSEWIKIVKNSQAILCKRLKEWWFQKHIKSIRLDTFK
jgi:hypothetical protein